MKNKKILLILVLIILNLGIYFVYNREIAILQNSEIKQNLLLIPVDLYIIKYDNKSLSSARDEENINEVFRKVNDIWSQANIKVYVEEIKEMIVDEESNYYDLNLLLEYMTESGNYDPNRINAYFAKTLHGSNGIALLGNRIMVADETTVYDFRATSHEIGHVLGLQHVRPVSRLMARGVNGFELNDEEIEVARNNALALFSD